MTINSFLVAFLSGFSPTMNDPTTPSTSTPADSSIVTPTGVSNPRTPPRTTQPDMSAIIDLFVDVLDEGDADRAKLKQGLELLIIDHWKVKKWFDMRFFSSDDVKAALVSGNGFPEELLAPVIVKKVGCVIDYSPLGILTPELTLDEVMRQLAADRKRANSSGSATGSPARKNSSSSDHTYDKKNMPKLGKFSGLDEDYFSWKDTTVNLMGVHGFSNFLTSSDEVIRHPSVGQSVFYILRTAVHGGQAQSIAQAMVDDNTLDPVALWSGLEDYYDTAVNRANVVLFDVRRLLSIRLDPDVTGSSFVSDFRDCLQRLRKNKATLAEDKDTLRALLLVAIQDDAFESVRDAIVQHPDKTVEAILTDIREKETVLNIKDQASSVSGDGTASSRTSRRSVSFSSGSNQKQRSSATAAGGDSGTTSFKNKWNVPKFPDTWRNSVGGPFYKLLIEWRAAAHQQKTQSQLNDLFNTTVEKFKSMTVGTNPSKKGHQTKKSRRTKQKTSASDSNAKDESGNDEDESSVGDETVTRKRIRLQKSRRVVTEVNA